MIEKLKNKKLNILIILILLISYVIYIHSPLKSNIEYTASTTYWLGSSKMTATVLDYDYISGKKVMTGYHKQEEYVSVMSEEYNGYVLPDETMCFIDNEKTSCDNLLNYQILFNQATLNDIEYTEEITMHDNNNFMYCEINSKKSKCNDLIFKDDLITELEKEKND